MAALAFLRDRTPANATIASLWEHGYEIQAYAGRPTLVDGFLESGDQIGRVVAMARAGMQASPESLAAWCRSLGAGYLLVPPSTQLLSVAMLAADPILPKLRSGQHLTPGEADRTLVRMMVYGRDEPPFRKVYESGLWRVYALGDSTGRAAADRLQ
jgi:hypothetical protein